MDLLNTKRPGIIYARPFSLNGGEGRIRRLRLMAVDQASSVARLDQLFDSGRPPAASVVRRLLTGSKAP
jgi:hypothetical protein